MTLPAHQLILLDTNVVIHLARNDRTGAHIESIYSLTKRREKPLVSTVTEGELWGFALYRRWGDRKLERLRKLLSEFVRVEAGAPEIVMAYAEIYADGEANGNPCGKQQNDIWIAATAKAASAILLTCDRDFDWMDGVHIRREYIDPQVSDNT